MKASRLNILIVLTFAAVMTICSCRRTPSGVLSRNEMAEVLADIYIGESVVESDYMAFQSDSARKALKQAILERHGVTQQQLDTSFVWYGHHLDRYIEVHERASDILQHRLDRAGAMGSEGASVIAGDSVDVWPLARRFEIGPRSASDIVAFSLKYDDNWHNGDSYTWRMKLHNSPVMARWGINAQYADGSTEVFSTVFAGDGWHEITFFCDSTLRPVRVYGDLMIDPGHDRRVFVDSVELIRNRLSPTLYTQRYRQHMFDLRSKGGAE